MAAARRRPSVQLVDDSLVTDELKRELRERALKAVAEERAQKAADVLYAQYLEEARRSHDPQEELKYITLDMAGHSDRIMMDGVVFFHGMTYAIPKSKYDSLRDIIARGWEHEGEIGFANRGRNTAPRQRDTIVSARTGALNAPRSVVGV